MYKTTQLLKMQLTGRTTNMTVTVQFNKNNQLTRVCVGDLIGFVGIQPHLLLATAQDAGRQALLEPEHAG